VENNVVKGLNSWRRFSLRTWTTDDFLGTFRYKNQLNPDIIKEPWKMEEDIAVLAAQAQVGNKWTEM
jgi:hypothetical protein